MVAIIVAIIGFDMPLGMLLMSAAEGAAFGLLPIVYIVIMAVRLYSLCAER